MDLVSMMEDASSSKRFGKIDDEGLKSVGSLADEQYKLEFREDNSNVEMLAAMDLSVPELEEALKLRKVTLQTIKESSLPNALEAFGLSEVKLLDGSKVTVKDEVYSAITEENKPAAFSWLEKTGNDGIIKNEFKVPFGKGQDSEAKELESILREHGISYSSSRSIHYQTLRAFVKQQLEGGKPIPSDIFSIHVKKVATIKRQG